jgi:hypothetical protein
MTQRALRFAAALVLAALAALPAFGAGQSTRNQATRDGAILALHPIAYWPLDDAGAVVADTTATANDGIYEGARGGAPGSNPGHTAALFSGIPGINLFGTIAAVQGNDARTVITWIRTWSPDPQAIFASGFPEDSGAFNLVVGYGGCPSLGVMGFNDDFYPCGRFLNDGFWHMVAATYDGAGSLNLYVDGTLEASTSITYATFGQNNYIGHSNHFGVERVFQGYIDDVAVFDRALDPSDIAALARK